MSDLRITTGELEELTKSMFNAGFPSFRVLNLDKDSAREYQRIFEQLDIPKIKTKVDGPSLQNDPLEEKERYSVTVYR